MPAYQLSVSLIRLRHRHWFLVWYCSSPQFWMRESFLFYVKMKKVWILNWTPYVLHNMAYLRLVLTPTIWDYRSVDIVCILKINESKLSIVANMGKHHYLPCVSKIFPASSTIIRGWLPPQHDPERGKRHRFLTCPVLSSRDSHLPNK